MTGRSWGLVQPGDDAVPRAQIRTVCGVAITNTDAALTLKTDRCGAGAGFASSPAEPASSSEAAAAKAKDLRVDIASSPEDSARRTRGLQAPKRERGGSLAEDERRGSGRWCRIGCNFALRRPPG